MATASGAAQLRRVASALLDGRIERWTPCASGSSVVGATRACGRSHSKCVVVDGRAWFVTSANFTRREHERYIEVGALIDDPCAPRRWYVCLCGAAPECSCRCRRGGWSTEALIEGCDCGPPEQRTG